MKIHRALRALGGREIFGELLRQSQQRLHLAVHPSPILNERVPAVFDFGERVEKFGFVKKLLQRFAEDGLAFGRPVAVGGKDLRQSFACGFAGAAKARQDGGQLGGLFVILLKTFQSREPFAAPTFDSRHQPIFPIRWLFAGKCFALLLEPAGSVGSRLRIMVQAQDKFADAVIASVAVDLDEFLNGRRKIFFALVVRRELRV